MHIQITIITISSSTHARTDLIKERKRIAYRKYCIFVDDKYTEHTDAD